MITISFYSYKGGVGRSLALTNLGVYLAQFGATVVMIDFDLEAPGLHYKLRPDGPVAVPSRGLAGLLADLSVGKSLEEIDFDIAIDVSQHAAPPELEQEELRQETGQLLLIPAGDPMRPEYWQDLGAIDWDQLFTRQPRPGVAALAQLKQALIDRHEPDVVLVDSRTGITPGGGVSTTLLPDVVVTLLLNTAEHLDGSRMVVSAVTGSGGGEVAAPRVLPVLSRYSSPPPRRASVPARRRAMALQHYEPDHENIPLDELRERLVTRLSERAAERVQAPLVLHNDASLAYNERLAFGPYAGFEAGGPGQALVEDYVRLFAALVPRDTFLRYLAGVRARVRGILLDRPDDAVRTLESLATMVGDEAAFIDLVKLYVLRRDTRNLIRAAERLFRVHQKIVVHSSLSEELRAVAMGQRPWPSADPLPGTPFMEAYWRQAAPQDVAWGATVVRRAADAGNLSRARELGDELAVAAPDGKALGSVIRVIAGGSDPAEKLAVQLALKYFDVGVSSAEFLDAAAVACGYQPDETLALKILQAPSDRPLPAQRVFALLETANRYEEADKLLLETLTEIQPFESPEDWQVTAWQRAQQRTPALGRALAHRNPEVLDYLESTQPPE